LNRGRFGAHEGGLRFTKLLQKVGRAPAALPGQADPDAEVVALQPQMIQIHSGFSPMESGPEPGGTRSSPGREGLWERIRG
jgi:hypothetical protein